MWGGGAVSNLRGGPLSKAQINNGLWRLVGGLTLSYHAPVNQYQCQNHIQNPDTAQLISLTPGYDAPIILDHA